MIKKTLFVLLIVFTCFPSFAQKQYYETESFEINFQPVYPLILGEESEIYLKTPLEAEEVTISIHDEDYKLQKLDNLWRGIFLTKEDAKEGWQELGIEIKYHKKAAKRAFWQNILGLIGIKPKPETLKSIIWIKAVRKEEKKPEEAKKIVLLPPKTALLTEEVTLLPPEVEPVIKEATPTRFPLLIKGSRIFSFSTKSIEGSKEGFVPGTNREESLRINVSGTVGEVDVDANFFSTSSYTTTQVSTKEEKVSILLRHASTEVYLGDFTFNLSDTEFGRFNKVLSGIRTRGDYENWQFKAFYSSPQGNSKYTKMYGNRTQGPYKLDNSNVVIDSERVYLDKIRQKRGDDYEIDYYLGEITFKNKIIIETQIIEVFYDYHETTYPHTTYGLRTKGYVLPNLEMGLTYLNDSDGTENAQTIYSSSQIPPKSHQLIELDGTLNITNGLKIYGEGAFMHKNENLLDSQIIEGKAGKIKTQFSSGLIDLDAHYKKVGSTFEPIQDPSPKKNHIDYGGILEIRPSQTVKLKGGYQKESFLQEDVAYELEGKEGNFYFTPENLPTLSYRYYELNESNDPVLADRIDRTTNINQIQSSFSFLSLNGQLLGNIERRLRNYPSSEAITYRKAGFGLSTKGIENLTLAGDIERKETVDENDPSELTAYTNTYNLNLSYIPEKRYLITGSMNFTDDSVEGIRNVTELAYKANPIKAIKSEGKLNIQSLEEDFGTTPEAVTKNTASFKLELRPIKQVKVRYNYQPKYTMINRTEGLSYKYETQQIDLNLLPTTWTFIGYTYKDKDSFSIDKTDYPDFKRKQSTSTGNRNIYSLKFAPFKILSTEFAYSDDKEKNQSLNQDKLSYSTQNNLERNFESTIRTSLTQTFAVDLGYQQKHTLQGTGEATSDLTDLLSQTGSVKGTLKVGKNWQFTLSYAFSKAVDNLLIADNITYSSSPSAGFVYRTDFIRVEGKYTYSKSYLASSTEKSIYSLKGKYSPSENFHLSLRGDREISLNPDYKTTEISGYAEIVL